MSLNIGDNFKYLGKKFLDDRESFATLAEMKACNDVPDGFITYCVENDERYEYNSSNIEDENLGKWVLYISEVDLADHGVSELINDSNFAAVEYSDFDLEGKQLVFITLIEYNKLSKEEQDNPNIKYVIVNDGGFYSSFIEVSSEDGSIGD